MKAGNPAPTVSLTRRTQDCLDCFTEVQRHVIQTAGGSEGSDLFCYLHSKEGIYYKVSKNVLCQTSYMRKIMSSVEIAAMIHGRLDLFFPDVECRLLESIITFLYHGVLSCTGDDKVMLFNVLVKQFGFPIDMEFTVVGFDSDSYDDLHSVGINSHHCEVCEKNDLKLKDLYPHVQNHVDDEMAKNQVLVGSGRHVTCIFCKSANGINYMGHPDEMKVVSDHLESHLEMLAEKLKSKYSITIHQNLPKEPIAKVNGGAPRPKPGPKSKKKLGLVRNFSDSESLGIPLPIATSAPTSNFTPPSCEKVVSSVDKASKRCKICKDTVEEADVLRHFVSHHVDHWKKEIGKRNHKKKFVCRFNNNCRFSTGSRKDMVDHHAIYHEGYVTLFAENGLDLYSFFESLPLDGGGHDDTDKYLQHVSDDETDTEEPSITM